MDEMKRLQEAADKGWLISFRCIEGVLWENAEVFHGYDGKIYAEWEGYDYDLSKKPFTELEVHEGVFVEDVYGELL